MIRLPCRAVRELPLPVALPCALAVATVQTVVAFAEGCLSRPVKIAARARAGEQDEQDERDAA